ncbi:MAG: sigma-54-dependent Fis family transcriptional regulator [Nitrospirae bacterium]|nr:sigma-54-dependent Fis family transcriptional regulator [Nitrospirota bacterium]
MRALVVDDEANIRKSLIHLLGETGFESFQASGLAEAGRLIALHYFDLAIIDLRLGDGSGIDLLKELKELGLDTVVLIITAFASTETAISAMKLGAYDYVTKPFNIEEIRIVLKNIKEKIFLRTKVRELEQFADSYQSIVGKSDAMQQVFTMIDKIAPFDTNVLITGESGTGKELVAKAIHNRSTRNTKPFVTINCANLPAELLESELFGHAKGAFTGAHVSKRGLIDEADGGTLLLDEIGEMPMPLQSKLLRFLEEKKMRPLGSSNEVEVDVRVIAATNKRLNELASKNDFRGDLYYRLSTFEIQLPPLRERREDIPLLIDYFAAELSKKFQKNIAEIDPEFVDYMMQQDLKGNVRELKNMIEREIILSEDGHLRCRQRDMSPSPCNSGVVLPDDGVNLNEYLNSMERNFLEKALEKAGGVKMKAAELLGLSFREFRYRLSKHSRKQEKSGNES